MACCIATNPDRRVQTAYHRLRFVRSQTIESVEQYCCCIMARLHVAMKPTVAPSFDRRAWERKAAGQALLLPHCGLQTLIGRASLLNSENGPPGTRAFAEKR